MDRIPTEKEINSLPKRAIVAFAARCARRVLPFVLNSALRGGDKYVIRRAVRLAADFAAGTGVFEEAYYSSMAEAALKISRKVESSNKALSDAAMTASHAVFAALTMGTPDSPSNAYHAARRAVWVHEEGIEVGDMHRLPAAIARDFEDLWDKAKAEHWNEKTLVYPSVFQQLWPFGAPAWAQEDAPDWVTLGKVLNKNIEELQVSSRVLQVLKATKITKVGQLAAKKQVELLKFLKQEALQEVRYGLSEIGLNTGMAFPEHLLEESEDKGVQDDLVFDIWIDPGRSSVEEIQAFFQALSDLHRANGGYGLTFVSGKDRVLVPKAS